MSILLDFDMDFFVRPIYRESRDNYREYLNEPCQLMPMESFFRTLESKNLRWKTEDVKLFTNHKKSYTFWWTRKYADCTLIHIDAHSDFYRPHGRDLMNMKNGEITCYNYIWYAVRDGYVNKIYWVIPSDHELMFRLADLKSMAVAEFGDLPVFIDLETHSLGEKGLLDEAVDIIRNAIDIRMPCNGHLSSQGISLECPVNTIHGERLLEIVICPVEELPVFNEPIHLVTAATSPEFTSLQSDVMIPEFCQRILASNEMCSNIQSQHDDIS